MGYLLHRGKKKAPVADLKQEDATLLADLTALESRAAGSIGVEVLTAVEPKHSSGLELGADTLAPRPFRGVVEREFCVTSYSGLIRTADDSGERPERDERPSVEHETAGLVENPAFRFPRGPRAGTFLHAVFEQIDFPMARDELLRSTIEGTLLQHGMELSYAADVALLVRQVLDTPLDRSGRLTLRSVARNFRRDEMEFHFPLGGLDVHTLRGALARSTRFREASSSLQFDTVRGFMRGFMDLVFQSQGRVYLVDYKSNYLGNTLQDYGETGVMNAMTEHHYDLQYLIYTVALDRYLAVRVPDYEYERHFGGAFYLFLRGMRPEHGPRFGVFHDLPDPALIADLGRAFEGTGA